MTSDEIRGVQVHIRKAIGDGIPEHPEVIPLWEIAYQLAVMNERNDIPKLKHNPFGESLGSAVGADSETEVRWKHPYISTACMHALHDRCRLSCKFCTSPCMCECHAKPQPDSEGA